MAEAGAVVVPVGGFGVVVGMMSSQDLSLMMWMSSRAKLLPFELGHLACKIICNEARSFWSFRNEHWFVQSSIYQGMLL